MVLVLARGPSRACVALELVCVTEFQHIWLYSTRIWAPLNYNAAPHHIIDIGVLRVLVGQLATGTRQVRQAVVMTPPRLLNGGGSDIRVVE